jgi:protein-tyrosine phosphatase
MSVGAPGRFIGIHHHLLPGLDDGAKDWAETEAMLRLANADNVGSIIATTHADPGRKPFQLTQYRENLCRTNALCRKLGLPITVYEGAEIFYRECVVERQLGGREDPYASGIAVCAGGVFPGCGVCGDS